MRNNLIILLVSAALLISCSGTSGTKSGNEETSSPGATSERSTVSAPAGKTVQLTKDQFKQLVMNYEQNPQTWVFEGDKPCIVDFYADWCKPCKMIAPIMEELAAEYAGQINIYKVNTDQERELASVFGINSIPYVLFVPLQGDPSVQRGALPKESYKEIIDDFLLKKDKSTGKLETSSN